jgi:hypothetical protein
MNYWKIDCSLIAVLCKTVNGEEASVIGLGLVLLDTRWEFRSFSAVEHLAATSHFTSYPAAGPSHLHLHLPAYSATHATAAWYFRRLLHGPASCTATTGYIFNDYSKLLKAISQQSTATKVDARTERCQQHFSLTPSESDSLFIDELGEISSWPEQVIDFASSWEVQ